MSKPHLLFAPISFLFALLCSCIPSILYSCFRSSGVCSHPSFLTWANANYSQNTKKFAPICSNLRQYAKFKSLNTKPIRQKTWIQANIPIPSCKSAGLTQPCIAQASFGLLKLSCHVCAAKTHNINTKATQNKEYPRVVGVYMFLECNTFSFLPRPLLGFIGLCLCSPHNIPDTWYLSKTLFRTSRTRSCILSTQQGILLRGFALH